ncbi:MAG: DUF3572 domain-containing protein [Magnetospirillum sp.]|nr:DUF3572 domain-containing protein [Magnetospirillum sp.]
MITAFRWSCYHARLIPAGANMDPFKPYQPRPRQSAPAKLTTEDAQAVALKALAFLAGDEALLSGFVSATGCGLDEIRGSVGDDGFLAAVLDFLLGDEPALIAFAEAENLPPETPMLARMKLAPMGS